MDQQDPQKRSFCLSTVSKAIINLILIDCLCRLNPKDIVIEYVGEKIRDPVADKREITYSKLGVGDCYNFRLNKDYIIDATFFGSKARYINHSCEPNLISEYLTVNGETHIIFVAARKIRAGEELTFDYNFMPEIESIECFCGSEKCRGRLA